MKCSYCKGFIQVTVALSSSYEQPVKCKSCLRELYLFRPVSKLLGYFAMTTIPFLCIVYYFLRWDLLLVLSVSSLSLWYLAFIFEYKVFGFTDNREPRYGLTGKDDSP
jgi:hypothetical protein